MSLLAATRSSCGSIVLDDLGNRLSFKTSLLGFTGKASATRLLPRQAMSCADTSNDAHTKLYRPEFVLRAAQWSSVVVASSASCVWDPKQLILRAKVVT